jgi:ribosomal protein L11 methyltransferase
MPFLQLTLPVGAADPAPIEAALLGAGALSITLLDGADHPVLEPAPGATPLWPTVRIEALFDAAADPEAIAAALRTELNGIDAPLSFATLADRAWEREWLKDFRPMQFGRRTWVCPGGQQLPITAEQLRDACVIELDPGLAFGTGTHATTALCLEWLDSAPLSGKCVLDYGCGSGVLAIAALKLGARHAYAVDIDPQALLATRDNAARNGVADRLTAQLAHDVQVPPAQILLANILAEPLTQLAPKFAEFTVTNGALVLSGILASQTQGLRQCYAPWFDLPHLAVREEWACLSGIRRPLDL